MSPSTLVFAVLLLLFGGSKLPELAKGLGKSIKEFKHASREDAPSRSHDVADVSVAAPAPAAAEAAPAPAAVAGSTGPGQNRS